MRGWQPIETAPRDGTHILVGDFTPGAVGFGRFAGQIVPAQTVAHWWGQPGQEGFYVSVGGAQDGRPLRMTHWRPLPLPLPKRSGIWNCPCGFKGGSRNIIAHRVKCPAWLNKRAADNVDAAQEGGR